MTTKGPREFSTLSRVGTGKTLAHAWPPKIKASQSFVDVFVIPS